jgi:hypothetical protein
MAGVGSTVGAVRATSISSAGGIAGAAVAGDVRGSPIGRATHFRGGDVRRRIDHGDIERRIDSRVRYLRARATVKTGILGAVGGSAG